MSGEEIRKQCLGKFEERTDLFESAEENIEKYRKGDKRLKIVDADGKPLRGARVRVRQTSHDFKYGANLFLLDEFGTEWENKLYRDTFHQYFNLATVPFYWAETEPTEGELRYDKGSRKIYRRPPTDLCFEYCEDKGILPKIHCLFYDKFTPDWLPRDDVERMLELYEKRFREIAERYSGRVYEVEVTNEMLETGNWKRKSVLCDRHGIMDWCYNTARRYFKNDVLVFNEGNKLPHIGAYKYRSPYILLAELLLAKGLPVDKLGMQHHVFFGCMGGGYEELPHFTPYFDPELITEGLGVISELGKPMEITETTIPTIGEGSEAEELQAELLRYLYTYWFACPNMESVVYWNTVEGMTFVQDPKKKVDDAVMWDENRCRGGLFRRDLSPKPAALMLKRLFGEVWRTDLELISDEGGEVSFRGFFGDYTVTVDGKELAVAHHKGGEDVTLRY